MLPSEALVTDIADEFQVKHHVTKGRVDFQGRTAHVKPQTLLTVSAECTVRRRMNFQVKHHVTKGRVDFPRTYGSSKATNAPDGCSEVLIKCVYGTYNRGIYKTILYGYRIHEDT